MNQTSRLMRFDLWLLVLLGILGVGFFLLKFNESFPSASIDLSVPKSKIVASAKEWARAAGYDPDGALESTIFSFDDDGKTFLEYELGQAKANQLMKNEVPIWMWRTRFCREFQQEECNVGMLTDGRLAYFEHSLPNDAKLPSISSAEARKLAEEFVEKRAGVSLAGTELIDSSDKKQVNRVDHYFNWKQLQPDYRDGKLYIYVYVAGNQITEYNRYLHVPDKFRHKYDQMRSLNIELKNLSAVIYTILSSAISFIFIWAFAQGKIRWKLAIAAAVVTGVFSVLAWIDDWPTMMYSYPTVKALEQFKRDSLIGMLTGTAVSMLQSFVFVGALEPIYRLMFPEKIALERLFGPLGLRSEQVFRGIVAGLAVFGVHTAYVVAFYLIGQHLGFWSPLDVRDAATLSRLWPVFEAINVGVFAGTTEELMYRVLALALFQKLTKNFWVANLLQAASWAFMHSDYPQEPAYVRGIELTIGGTFYGWVLRRFGLIACVLAHYTYDAFLGVTPLITSASGKDRWSALIAVLPGIIALCASSWLIFRKGVLADETPLTNKELAPSFKPPPAAEIEPRVELPYTPLSTRVRTLLIGLAIALAAGSQLVQPREIGSREVVTVSSGQATAIARGYLGRQGIDVRGMQTAAWLSADIDDEELQYVYEKEGFARTRELATAKTPRLTWRVRFFKELEPTEYYVTLSSTGAPFSQYIVKDEDAPGAKLSEAQAKQKVDQFLKEQHGNVFPLEATEAPTRHDQKNRTDYEMYYSAPRFKAANADFEVSSGTVGGDVSGYTARWKIPDEWNFERAKKSSRIQQITGPVQQLLYGSVGILLLWWMIQILRSHSIRWRPAIYFGCAAAATTLIHSLNGIPNMLVSYRTEEALQTHFTNNVSSILMQVISVGGGMALLAAFAYGAFRLIFNLNLPELIRPILPKGLGGAGSNRDLWLDAVIAGFCGIAIVYGLDRFYDAIVAVVSPAVPVLRMSSVADFTEEWSLWLKAFASAISAAVLLTLVVAIAAAACMRLFRGSYWKIVVASIAVAAVLWAGSYYWQDIATSVVSAAIYATLGYLFVTRVARFNVLAYALIGYIGILFTTILNALRSAPQVYFGDIAVMCVALAAPIAYTIWLWAFPAQAAQSRHRVPSDES